MHFVVVGHNAVTTRLLRTFGSITVTANPVRAGNSASIIGGGCEKSYRILQTNKRSSYTFMSLYRRSCF